MICFYNKVKKKKRQHCRHK